MGSLAARAIPRFPRPISTRSLAMVFVSPMVMWLVPTAVPHGRDCWQGEFRLASVMSSIPSVRSMSSLASVCRLRKSRLPRRCRMLVTRLGWSANGIRAAPRTITPFGTASMSSLDSCMKGTTSCHLRTKVSRRCCAARLSQPRRPDAALALWPAPPADLAPSQNQAQRRRPPRRRQGLPEAEGAWGMSHSLLKLLMASQMEI